MIAPWGVIIEIAVEIIGAAISTLHVVLLPLNFRGRGAAPASIRVAHATAASRKLVAFVLQKMPSSVNTTLKLAPMRDSSGACNQGD